MEADVSGRQGAPDGADRAADEDRLLSRFEAACFLGGISMPTLHALINSGQLKVVKVARRTMIPLSSIRNYIEACCQ